MPSRSDVPSLAGGSPGHADNAAAMTTTHRRTSLARALLWLTPALWSTNYLIARAAADVVGPHQLAFGRWLLALALMLPFTWAALAAQPRAWLREWPHLLALGALPESLWNRPIQNN